MPSEFAGYDSIGVITQYAFSAARIPIKQSQRDCDSKPRVAGPERSEGRLPWVGNYQSSNPTGVAALRDSTRRNPIWGWNVC